MKNSLLWISTLFSLLVLRQIELTVSQCRSSGRAATGDLPSLTVAFQDTSALKINYRCMNTQYGAMVLVAPFSAEKNHF